MEFLQAGDGAAGRAETSKAAKADETSTRYKHLVSYGDDESADEIVALSPPKAELRVTTANVARRTRRVASEDDTSQPSDKASVLQQPPRGRSPSSPLRSPMGSQGSRPTSNEGRPRTRPSQAHQNGADLNANSTKEDYHKIWQSDEEVDVEPRDSGSKRQMKKPSTVSFHSDNGRPPRATSTTREGQQTPRDRQRRRRTRSVSSGDEARNPLPPRQPSSRIPDHIRPHSSMPPMPYHGPYKDFSYNPFAAPQPFRPRPFGSPPYGSPPYGFPPYAPSMISGTTVVPTPPNFLSPDPYGYQPLPPSHPSSLPPYHPSSLPTPPAPPPPPPPPPDAREPTIIDPIVLVEEYLGVLKKSKEKELLDANRILSWIDRYSSAKKESSPPLVESFRIQDDESDTSESRAASTLKSYAKSSTPARPTFELPTPRASCSGQVAESQTVERILEESTESSLANFCRHNAVRQCNPTSHTIVADVPEASERSGTSLQHDHIHSNDAPIDEALENFDEKLLREFDALREDLAALKRQLVRKDTNWLSSIASSAYTRWKKWFRRVPRPGTQRLEWTCECGDELFADLPIASSTQYQQMRAFLTRPAPITRPAGHGFTTSSDLESGAVGSNFSSPQSSPNSFSNGKAPASTLGSGSTYVGSRSSQSFTFQQNPFAMSKYLELCVNVGKYETKLAEIQVMSNSAAGSTICTDGHLFRKIHDRYFAQRKHTWRRFLYRPVGIKFVHFGVQVGHQVSFFTRDPLPPEEVLASKCYEYNLQPPVPPPIDSRTFLHYFWKHSAHSQSTSARYVDRLPKKLGESLVRSLGTDELREGWGIHILEGPNKVAMCWTLMVILVTSFGVSLGYDLIANAGDSGFAIGQWMVAALAVVMSALYFGLEDEVDSRYD